MDEYTEHNDRANLEQRLRVLTNREERARMARAAEEQDIGCVTLWMPKRDLQARLEEARGLFRFEHLLVDWLRAQREPRNEREFNLQWRAQP